jgi:hypothetical protein
MSGDAAARALEEALAYTQRLATGVKALGQLGEVSFGCSEKEAVLRRGQAHAVPLPARAKRPPACRRC